MPAGMDQVTEQQLIAEAKVHEKGYAAAVQKEKEKQEEAHEQQTKLAANTTLLAQSPTEIRVVVPSKAPELSSEILVSAAMQSRDLNNKIGGTELKAEFSISTIQKTLTETKNSHELASKKYKNYANGWLAASTIPGMYGVCGCIAIAGLSGPPGWVIGAGVLTALAGIYIVTKIAKNAYASSLLDNTHQHITALEDRFLNKIGDKIPEASKDNALFFINLRKFIIDLGNRRSIKSLRCLREIERILKNGNNDSTANISDLQNQITSAVNIFLQSSKNKFMRFFTDDADFCDCCRRNSDLLKESLPAQQSQNRRP